MDVINPMLKEAQENAGGFALYKDLAINGGSEPELQSAAQPKAVYDCVPGILKPSADGAPPAMPL